MHERAGSVGTLRSSTKRGRMETQERKRSDSITKCIENRRAPLQLLETPARGCAGSQWQGTQRMLTGRTPAADLKTLEGILEPTL